MASFPTSDVDLAVLARRVAAGLSQHVAIYPVPPVPSAELEDAVASLVNATERENAARRNLEAANTARQHAAEVLKEKTKLTLTYAESAVDFDDAKLRLLGWEGRKPRKALVPGPPRSLELVRVQEGIIELDWKKPGTGGDAQSYRIEARKTTEERWMLKGFSLHSDCVLHNLEPGQAHQVRVIAVNKMGDGEPSEAIEVAL